MLNEIILITSQPTKWQELKSIYIAFFHGSVELVLVSLCLSIAVHNQYLLYQTVWKWRIDQSAKILKISMI